MLLANGRVTSNTEAAPQALAELDPQLTESYYYAESEGLRLERAFARFGHIYRKQPWVRTVIDKRAMAVARLPTNVWTVQNGTRSVDTGSAYAKLISDPCPYMDPFRFWAWIQTTIDIYGETYLAIIRGKDNKPVALYPMHPSRVAIKRDRGTGRYTYLFTSGVGPNSALKSFDQDDVVPFRLFNPNKLERGLSRMESLESTIFSEDASRNATSSMWRNAGRPNMILTSEKALGPKGKERLTESFNMQHAGTDNAGKTLVLEDGVTAASYQLTAVEMQFIESRQLNREEVCGVYDIAPPMVHILDKATFSNITAQMRGFYRDTMAPPLELIESAINKYVGANWTTKNEFKFAVEEILRGDFEARAESVQKMLTSGVATPNEGREVLGLSKFDDPKADDLYANSALQPLGAPAERITLNGTVAGDTPDGVVAAAAPPATTPVAALDGSKPTSVPAQPKPAPVSVPKPPPKAPSHTSPSAPPKHLRAIKGELGRGRSDDEIKAFAIQLADKYPDDLGDILKAVQLAIAERKGK